ncbi:hypothetical protein [uncultured Sphingomonas sp.]|uniref:hypothetical protein n=1 Tax=uncultured Sphingomonas sp. TaxID=158754 RepID=UPI002592D1FE|nr:hypothetical protein [uncultured Sphingomonas sp.]
MAVRPYRPDDRAAVLAIFDGNAAHYFGAGDRGWLAETLDEPDGPAFVVTVGAQVAAFGGYEIWDHYNNLWTPPAARLIFRHRLWMRKSMRPVRGRLPWP